MTKETRWLDEDEQTAWRHYLRASRALSLALDRELLDHGMSLAEYEILSMLSEAEGRRLRMGALADLVVQSRSRITHTATRLQRRGWVTRESCSSDSRGVELVLTDGGYDALLLAAPVHVASVRRYFVDTMDGDQLSIVGDGMRRVHEQVGGEGG
ncbi:MarR family winged helix-turn-helix transcriptional regulator [Dermacoccus sp. GAS27A]|uniref:MarR family winged helix-turn-helix transcriptional regulator n=1 Tax=Dermacoccus sp. GAS27A TaxID=3156270 RepID=UPI003833C65B